MSTKTQVSGDEYVEVNADTPIRNRDYMISAYLNSKGTTVYNDENP